MLCFVGTSIATLWVGCGGSVVVGTGGSGGSSPSTTASSTTPTSSSTTSGTGGSPDHDGGTVGAPCQSSAACATPETCVTNVPGGYCTIVIAECSADPFDPAFCPPGAWCVNAVQFGGKEGDFCFAKCEAPADCRPGYTCEPWGDAGVCFYGQFQ
jgi:hypothetical protein